MKRMDCWWHGPSLLVWRHVCVEELYQLPSSLVEVISSNTAWERGLRWRGSFVRLTWLQVSLKRSTLYFVCIWSHTYPAREKNQNPQQNNKQSLWRVRPSIEKAHSLSFSWVFGWVQTAGCKCKSHLHQIDFQVFDWTLELCSMFAVVFCIINFTCSSNG